MKAPTTRRVGRAPSKNDAATASKLVKPTSEEAVVQHLQHVLAELHRRPLPTGRVGCQFLDALELCDKIRTEVREKARELLLNEPGIIPGWRVNKFSMRTLDRDTAKIFDILARADDSLTPERFLEVCSTNLEAVRKLLTKQNPGGTLATLSTSSIAYSKNRSTTRWSPDSPASKTGFRWRNPKQREGGEIK